MRVTLIKFNIVLKIFFTKYTTLVIVVGIVMVELEILVLDPDGKHRYNG
jgi:hypothetical protein